MKILSKIALPLMLGLLMAPVARADPPLNVQIEINFLLGYVDGSGCEFYRNGTWYNSKAAQEHLRDKYKYMVKGSLINTTEDFIEKAATKSSFSGQPYGVKCNGGVSLTSNKWLRDELVRFRSF